VGGKSWTAQIPSGKVDNVALIDGVGLKFSFDGTDANSNLAPDAYTAPRLQIPVYGADGLVPGLAVDDTIAFQVLLSSGGLSDNWQVYGLHLSDGTTGNNWFENSTAYESSTNTSSPHLITEIQVGTGGQALTSLGSGVSDPGMRELVWYAGSAGFVSSHKLATGFADPLTSTGAMSGVLSSATNTVPAAAPSLNITIANATICLHAFYNDESGTPPPRNAWNCTISKFRVLKRAK
tara:strand:- start:483 stop:1190 length:708 start_codon:yes stop_codon:yes gene_type:complete